MSPSGIHPFTSESVTEGHPDKVCDRISDSILDAVLSQDPNARVAVETVATKGLVHVVGEMTTSAYVEIPQLVRDQLLHIGYDSMQSGFDGNSCGVSVSIGQQSADIAGSVSKSLESRTGQQVDARDLQGAGDQGIMFGFACNETPDLMPAPIWLANRLSEQLAKVRKTGQAPGVLPDGKTQVTLRYEDGAPRSIDTIVVSTQHAEHLNTDALTTMMRELVVNPVLKQSGLTLDKSDMRLLVNPSGRFVIGGPGADAGLTGRKIIVDTYGGSAHHGGGAFSGKDPSKVDRSGAYAARWVAKNVVAAGLASRVEIQLAYAIGSARPVSISVNTYGTGVTEDERLSMIIQRVFDLRPRGIVEDLGLLDTASLKYVDTSAYGHFGRPGFPWEKLDRVEELRAEAAL